MFHGVSFALPIILPFIIGIVIRFNCSNKATIKKMAIILPAVWLVCEMLITVIFTYDIMQLAADAPAFMSIGMIALSGWLGILFCHLYCTLLKKKPLTKES